MQWCGSSQRYAMNRMLVTLATRKYLIYVRDPLLIYFRYAIIEWRSLMWLANETQHSRLYSFPNAYVNQWSATWPVYTVHYTRNPHACACIHRNMDQYIEDGGLLVNAIAHTNHNWQMKKKKKKMGAKNESPEKNHQMRRYAWALHARLAACRVLDGREGKV